MEEKDLLGKKVERWQGNLNDFQTENELTVEITLNEYRELVKEVATKEYDIEKVNEDKYTREEENRKLKKRNEELTNELLEYKKLYGNLEENNEELEN